jgi:hypothetical protein
VKRKMIVEALEARRLLSVTAAALAFPIEVVGGKWTTEDVGDGTTDSYTVMPATSFGGHGNVTPIHDNTVDPNSTGPQSSNTYVGFDASRDFIEYGLDSNSVDNSVDPAVTTTVTDTINPPLEFLPAVMVAGTTYSQTTNLHAVEQSSNGNSSTNDATFNRSIKLVSDTKLKVTVPAGTFMCYQLQQVQTFTVNGKTTPVDTINYYVAPGVYPVKEVNTDGANVTTTVLTSFNIKRTPSQVKFDVQPSSANVNTAIAPTVTVQVEDVNGLLVTDNSSTVTLTVASGPGTITGGTAAAINGTASFPSLKFSKAGTYTIRASDGSLTADVSRSFQITAPSTSAKLAFDQQPSGAQTGDKIAPAVTVDIEDSSGTIQTGDTSSVTLAIDTGPVGGVLAGTVTVAAVHGVATFSDLVLNIPGTYTLTATDGRLTPDTSDQFKIIAKAKASQLAFAGKPADTVAGKVITPAVAVDVEFPGGAIVQNDTSTVTLAIASGPAGAVLGGTLSVAAINGVATFKNLVLTKAGTYTLKATDGTLTGATSQSFKITAAAATKLAFAATPPSTAAGKAITPAVVIDVEDQFGNIATTNTSNVIIAIASGGGTLGGTKTVAAKAGVATFANLTISNVGAHTLKATDGTLTSATSASFNITAGAAAKLVIATSPGNTVAGKALAPAIVVDIEDALGNIVTSNTSKVTLSVASGGGTLGGTVSVAAKAGVATFSGVLLTKAGAHTIKAADGSLTSATSKSFTITAAAAAKLVLAAALPATVTAGKAISPAVVVDVEDQFGNIVTTNTSTVKFSIASGPTGGTLTGTASVAAKAGVATFSNLLITKAGSYIIQATDGTQTAAKSATFKVVAAAASKLAFVQPPKPGKVNTTLSPAITVAIEDSFGNIVTSNTTRVTIAIASGPSGAALSGTLTEAAVNGVATFADLKLNKAGTYTLKVIDGVLASATSGTFSIT